jgi:ribosomal-protein-serine acetyltransferase
LSPGWLFSADPVVAADVLPLDLGGGLALLATTAADADEAFAVIDAERDRLRDWLPWVDGTVDVSVEREFLRGIEAVNAVGGGLHATLRFDGTLCGFVGLRPDLLHRSAEIGYWLSQRYVGRGLMTRSVAAMFDAGIGPLGMHRLELLAATGNRSSRRIAERLGMSFEGVRREAEELASGFVDLAMYAVLAQDWPGAAAALSRTRAQDTPRPAPNL